MIIGHYAVNVLEDVSFLRHPKCRGSGRCLRESLIFGLLPGLNLGLALNFCGSICGDFGASFKINLGSRGVFRSIIWLSLGRILSALRVFRRNLN